MDTKGVGRPKEWGKDSKQGQLLWDLIHSGDDITWAEITDTINESLGTDFKRMAIISAAYRNGWNLRDKNDVKIEAERVAETFSYDSDDCIPIIEINDDREWVPIWGTSDWHFGHKHFDHAGFAFWRQRALDLGAWCLTNGDLAEMSSPYGRMPATVWDQDATPDGQEEWILRALYPFKGRMFPLHPGNHEMREINLTNRCLLKPVATELGALFRRHGGMSAVVINGGEVEYNILAKHGSSFAQNTKLEVLRWAGIYKEADIVLLGHDHKRWAERFDQGFVTVIDSDTGHRYRKVTERWCGRTGHFLRYGGYVEDRPYQPHPSGSIMIWLNTHDHRIWIDSSDDPIDLNG